MELLAHALDQALTITRAKDRADDDDDDDNDEGNAVAAAPSEDRFYCHQRHPVRHHQRPWRQVGRSNVSAANNSIRTPQRRPSFDESLSSYLAADDDDDIDDNEELEEPVVDIQMVWTPEVPSVDGVNNNADAKYGYEDATPFGYGPPSEEEEERGHAIVDEDLESSSSSSECEKEVALTSLGRHSHHSHSSSTGSVDSVPKLPRRNRPSIHTVQPLRRRSSIQFGQGQQQSQEEEDDDDDQPSFSNDDKDVHHHSKKDAMDGSPIRNSKRSSGHAFVSEREAAEKLLITSYPHIPRRRPSRASISFGGDVPGTMPVRKITPPPSHWDSLRVAATTDNTTTKIDNHYGYEEASPSTAAASEAEAAAAAAAADKYGYGEVNPSRTTILLAPRETTTYHEEGVTLRRSSMKQVGCSRRASIQTVGVFEVNLPGHHKPIRRRTSISFASELDVMEVTPLCNLTNEPERLWYRKDELRQIRNKNYSIVQLVEQQQQQQQAIGGSKNNNGNNNNNNNPVLKVCTRGLEHMMETTGSQERLEQQQQSVESVLTLQTLQRNTGDYDCEYMSRLYQYTSRSSGEEAAERASQDAAAVEKYLKWTRLQCRRLSM
jgi:hypothetical protein